MEPFNIGKYSITQGGKPFIVAELSGNHNQSIDRAFELIDLAVEAGAHSIKLQTYTADSLTIDHHGPGFVVHSKQGIWDNKKLYDLYKTASTPYEWHGKIFEYCAKKEILCFSTPFDEAAVDFLEQFDPPCHKVASFENNHYPLIEKIAHTGKPMIISLGLSSLKEIEELNQFLIEKKVKNYILLKCCSTYPADPRYINLSTIPYLHNHLNVNVGLSDHTMGIGVAVASVAMGAQVIEKHFTDSRAKGGVDSSFSLEPHELKALVSETAMAWQGVGSVNFDLSEEEQKSLAYKRSIYVVQDIKQGEILTRKNLRVIRPSFGLAPKHFSEVIGKKAARDLTFGDPLSWDMVKPK
jgi:pseudaminic acid synthase